MPNKSQLEEALAKAHFAGDFTSANIFADMIKGGEFDDDTTFFGQVGETLKGIPRGFTSSYGTMLEGFGEQADTATNLLGQDDLVGSGEDNALVRTGRAVVDKSEETFKRDPAYDNWYTDFGDTLGSLASFLGPAGGVKLLGLAGKAAKYVPGMVMGSGLAAGEQGQRIERARDQGIDVSGGEKDAATLFSSVIGLSEVIPLERFFKGIPASALSGTFLQSLAPRIKKAIMSAGVEGVQELSADLMQDFTEKGIYNPDLEVGESAFDAFTQGGAAGFVADLALTAMAGRRSRKITDQDRAIEAELRAEESQKHAEDAVKFQVPENQLALPLLPAKPLDPNDPATGAKALADDLEKQLGESFPVDPNIIVDGTRVTDSQNNQLGPEFQSEGEATIFARVMQEKVQDRAVEQTIDRAINQSTAQYGKRDNLVLRILGRRLLSKKHNSYSAEKVNQAAGTVMEEGFNHESLSANEALKEGISLKDMTAVQRINAKRLKRGKKEKTTFTLRELRPFLKDKVSNLTPEAKEVSESDFDTLLKSKNITSKIDSKELRAAIGAITGWKGTPQKGGKDVDSFNNLTASEKTILFEKFRTLPKLDKPSPLPDYGFRPYDNTQYQTAARAAIENGSVPRETLEKQTGQLSDEAYQGLVNDLRQDSGVQAQIQQRKAETNQQEAEKALSDKEYKTVENAIKRRMNRFGLKRVGATIVDQIRNARRNAAGNVELGKTRLTGDSTEGAYMDALNEIFVAVDAIKQNPQYQAVVNESEEVRLAKLEELALETLNHEVLHAMRQADLFTKPEWELLEKTARSQYARDENGKPINDSEGNPLTYAQVASRVYGDYTAVMQMEEAIAEMVRDGLAGRLKIGGKPKHLMQRIAEFLKGMIRTSEKDGFRTFDDLIAGIKTGEIAARPEGEIRTLRATEKEAGSVPHRGITDTGLETVKGTPSIKEMRRESMGNIVSFSDKKKTKELKEFSKELHSRVSEGANKMRSLVKEVADEGYFDGYPVGVRIQGKISPMKIIGHTLTRVKYPKDGRFPNNKHMRESWASMAENLGFTPTLIEKDGEYFTPMLWYEKGVEGSGNYERGQLNLDAVKKLGHKVFGGPREPSILEKRRLSGMPLDYDVDGQAVEFGYHDPAVKAAQAYAEKSGVPYVPLTEYAPIDAERGKRLANEFALMEHAPNDPTVKAAYRAMMEETAAQYESILETGLEVEFIKGQDPYGNPRNAIMDVINNNHLYVFSTKDGFGPAESLNVSDNPLLQATRFKDVGGETMLANDVFRVVHDYFGHIQNGNGFRARGEENAWQAHAAMYSPLARRAMTVETRGQNSMVNFGPDAEFNRTASGADTIYAEQKIGLLPIWASEEARLSDHKRRSKQEYRAGLSGAIRDGWLELSHFSREPIRRTNPRLKGTGYDRATQGRRWLPEVTYFGITQANENGYRRESGLGATENVAKVDPSLIYPADSDPEGLWSRDYERAIKNMKEAGFSGYRTDHPSLGKVAVVWDALEVSPSGIKERRTVPAMLRPSVAANKSAQSKATLKKFWDKHFRAKGLLPKDVFDTKVIRDAEIGAGEIEIRHMLIDFDNAIKKHYHKEYKNLTEAQQETINDYLTDQTVSLPPAIKAALDPMVTYISSLSETLALSGAVKPPESIQKILDNRGKYMNRSYRAFDDKNWKKKVSDAVVQRAYVYLQQQMPTASRAQIIGHINNILDHGTAADSVGSFLREGKVGAMDVSMLIRRKDIAAPIRDLLGEYKNARVNFARTATKQQRAVMNYEFQKKVVADGVGKFLFEEPVNEFSVPLVGKDSKTMSEIVQTTVDPITGAMVKKPYFTTPEIKQAFEDALGSGGFSDLYKGFIAANALVKYGKTVIAPTTMSRNFISASMFSMANGHLLTPSIISDIKNSSSTLFGEVMHKTAQRDYMLMLKRLGVTLDNPYAGEMIGAINDAGIDSLAMRGAKGKARQTMDFFTKLYQYGDDFWKIIGFESERSALEKAGFSPQDAQVEAAQRIRDTYPTYSLVGSAIKRLRRFPLAGTFVSFPAEIVRTSVNIARLIHKDFQRPETRPIAVRRMVGMSIAAGFAHALSALSMAMMGIDDEADEANRKSGPPWSRNSNLLYVGYDKDGMPEYFDLSYSDPYNYLKRGINALMTKDNIDDTLISIGKDVLGPFLGPDIASSAIGEAIFNRKLEADGTGGNVYNPSADASTKAKEISAHIGSAIAPGVVGNLTRIYKASRGDQSRYSAKKYNLKDEMYALAGSRKMTSNPLLGLGFRVKEYSARKRDASRILSEHVAGQNIVSDNKLRSKFKEMMTSRERLTTDLLEYIDLTRSFNMTDSEIARVLIEAGAGKENIGPLMRGEIPRWKMGKRYMKSARGFIMATTPPNDRAESLEKLKHRIRLVAELAREYYKK